MYLQGSKVRMFSNLNIKYVKCLIYQNNVLLKPSNCQKSILHVVFSPKPCKIRVYIIILKIKKLKNLLILKIN